MSRAIALWGSLLVCSACGSSSNQGSGGTLSSAGSLGLSGSSGAWSSAGGAGGLFELAVGGFNSGSAGGPPNNCPTASATPGALDPSFGDAGFALLHEPSDEEGRILADIARASDGSAYGLGNNGAKMVFFHVDNGGAFDTSFGDQGFVTKPTIGEAGYGLSFDSRGDLLVAGSSIKDAWVERYTPGGQLDTGFGTAGRTTFDFGSPNDRFYKTLIKKDGSLVALGSNDSNGLGTAAVLAFMDENGNPLTDIGSAGIVMHKRDDRRYIPIDLVEQDQGAILVFGWVQASEASQSHPFWLRLDAEGNADPDFGQDGFVATSSGDASSIAITEDAQGLATGWAASNKLFAFDVAGAKTSFAAGALNSKSIAIDCAGRVLAAGLVSMNLLNSGALARFKFNGPLDASFASSGVALWASPDHSQFARVVALPDGRALVGGSTGKTFAIARYLQ